MVFEHLVDPTGAAIVLGGTLLVTLTRVGWREGANTLRQINELFRSPFDAAAQRAALARQVEKMRRDGIIGVEVGSVNDPDLAKLIAVVSRHRAIDAMIELHDRQRAVRKLHVERAIEPLENAGDLAPVLGLVGTLIALSQLSPATFETDGAVMGSISLAVVSTFYGLLIAHLVFLPLASCIVRRARREEEGRQMLVDWLAKQLQSAVPFSATQDRTAA